MCMATSGAGTRYGRLCSALIVIGLWMGCAAAEPPDFDANTLTGSWSGLRAEQSGRGWDWELGLRLDQMSVVRGGLAQGGRPLSHLDFKLKADLDKVIGWQGATAFFNLIDDRGGKPNADYAGSLLGVSNIEVPAATTRLFHAWIQKEWSEGQFSLLTGLYPIDSEFMVVDSAGVFVQPGFGALADIALSRGPSIFNNSAFGVRGRWASADRSLYAQGAVLDGIPGDPKRPVGTHVRFASGDGVMAIMEIGHRPVAEIPDIDFASDEMRPETEAKAPEAEPGFAKYALGLWGYSERVADLIDVDDHGAPVKRRSLGWYALAERTLWRETAVGDITVFARYSQNDGNSIALERALNLGVTLKGPFRGRDNDVAGLGYSRGMISDKYRAVLEADGVQPTRYEDAWELTYRFQMENWLSIQPVLQLIRHPGADQGVRNATVIGLRLDLAL